jgi:hypothetical protein
MATPTEKLKEQTLQQHNEHAQATSIDPNLVFCTLRLTTKYPAFFNRLAMCEPMKPAPPPTQTLVPSPAGSSNVEKAIVKSG